MENTDKTKVVAEGIICSPERLYTREELVHACTMYGLGRSIDSIIDQMNSNEE